MGKVLHNMNCDNCKNYTVERDHTPGFKSTERTCKGNFMDLKDFVCPGFEEGSPTKIDINPEEIPNYYSDDIDEEE